MLIFIDLDEVLCNFIEKFLLFHNRIKNTNFKFEQVKEYHMNKLWGVSREEIVKELKEYYDSKEFENLSIIPGAKKAIDILSKNNELIIITARPNFLKEKTEIWINKNFPNKFSTIYLTNEGTHNEPTEKKVDLCLKLGIKLVIEDSLENAIDCAKAGMKVFLLNKPWNQCENLPENINRVYSWEEIIEKTKNLLN